MSLPISADPLPTSYAFGKIVGRVIHLIADTAEDTDDKPQARAAAGKVTFKPKEVLRKTTDADYPAIVLHAPETANLSSSGRILDAEGRQGIWLAAGIYTVTFEINKATRAIPDFDIEVTTAYTEAAPLDLATVVPYVPPSGAVVQTVLIPAGGTEGQVLVRTADGGLVWANQTADVDLTGYATAAELSDGLATKVNSSTYTAGMADKQDKATLGADVTAAPAVKAAYRTVLTSDGTADQTARLNAALAAAPPAGTRKTVTLVGEFAITAPLVIPSFTRLDATDAVITTPSTAYPMLRNTRSVVTVGAPTNGSGIHDTDIEVVGGRWVAGATDGAHHRFFFHQVDRLSIHGCRIESASGKYAVLVADSYGFTVRDLTFDVASDGVHVTGPATDGLISNLTGIVGDDFVALGCSDYLTYDFSRGNITRVTVEKLRSIYDGDGGNGCKLFTVGDPAITETLVMSNITVRDVKGSVKENGVLLLDYAANNGSMRDVTVEDISVVCPVAGWAQVRHQMAGPMANLAIRDITVPEGTANDTTAVRISKSIDRVSISGIRSSATTGRVTGLRVSSAAHVNNINIDDLDIPLNDTTSRAIHISDADTRVGTLNATNVRTGGTAGTGAVIMVNGGALLSRFNLVNCVNDAGTQRDIISIQSPVVLEVNYANVTLTAPGTFVVLVDASATVTVRGGGYRQPSGAGLYRTGTQTARSLSPDWPVDISRLTRNNGDMATNTNGSLACGTGRVICDGTSWKNLATGATYTPA